MPREVLLVARHESGSMSVFTKSSLGHFSLKELFIQKKITFELFSNHSIVDRRTEETGDLFYNFKNNNNRNIKWLHTARLDWSKSPEALRSQINLKSHYLHPVKTGILTVATKLRVGRHLFGSGIFELPKTLNRTVCNH